MTKGIIYLTTIIQGDYKLRKETSQNYNSTLHCQSRVNSIEMKIPYPENIQCQSSEYNIKIEHLCTNR